MPDTKHHRIKYIAFLALIGATMATSATGCVRTYVRHGVQAPWAPWDARGAADNPIVDGVGLADRALAGYQRHLRRPSIERDLGCRFEPSCSVYARGAVQAHGTLVGVIMTANRLFFREALARPADFQPVRARGAMRMYDPAQ
jgi:putative component of membrane protein insertase Oxa1/YidC/SpoIIIJ protein YidD